MVLSLALTHLFPRLLIHISCVLIYETSLISRVLTVASYPSAVLPIDAHHHISVYYAYTDVAMETANAEASC